MNRTLMLRSLEAQLLTCIHMSDIPECLMEMDIGEFSPGPPSARLGKLPIVLVQVFLLEIFLSEKVMEIEEALREGRRIRGFKKSYVYLDLQETLARARFSWSYVHDFLREEMCIFFDLNKEKGHPFRIIPGIWEVWLRR